MFRLADNLRYLLETAKLSENALAEEIHVPQPTINRILNGKSRDPRDGTLEPIAKRFGVTVEALRRANLRESKQQVSRSRPAVDRDLLRQAVIGAEQVIRSYGAAATVTPEGRAAIVEGVYRILAQGAGMEAAKEVVAGMLDAFTNEFKNT